MSSTSRLFSHQNISVVEIWLQHLFTFRFLCGFRAEHYWWRGQNRRTLGLGQFPRQVVTAVAGLSAQDISRPLKHSFIHTGHGDTDPHRSWGFADRIDRLVWRVGLQLTKQKKKCDVVWPPVNYVLGAFFRAVLELNWFYIWTVNVFLADIDH